MKFIALLIVFAAIAAVVNGQTNVIPGVTDCLQLSFNKVTGMIGTLPVFLFHYTQGQTFSPDGNTSVVWSVPDELWPTSTDSSEEIITEILTGSYSEFASTYFSSFGFSIGITDGQFSLAFQYQHELYTAHAQLAAGSTSIGYSFHWYSMYNLAVAPINILTLHPWFEAELSALPTTISTPTDQTAYDQFICKYGTDIITNADFGIRLDVNQFVNNSVIQKFGSEWVSTQMGLNFHYLIFQISPGFFTNRSQIHVSQFYSNYSTSKIYFVGGDPALQNEDTLLDWVQSMWQYPHYLNISTQGLASVATSYPQTQVTLDAQIKNYITTGGKSIPNGCGNGDASSSYDQLFKIKYGDPQPQQPQKPNQQPKKPATPQPKKPAQKSQRKSILNL